MILRAAILTLALATPGAAQQAGETARMAAQMLTQAAEMLDDARSASDRIRALTEVVRAYEQGLAALRDGVRQVTIRERAISDDLEAREEEISRLLGVLSGMERAPAPLLLLHPSGPLGTARASMMLGDVTPGLRAEAEDLAADLAALRDLRAMEEAAADSLRAGLDGVQAARVALSEAIADRTDLPPRLASDTAALAALLDRVDTLQAFADGLADLPGAPDGQAILDLPLPPPVIGPVLRGFNQPDAAGIARPGQVRATAPGALVTAPAAGTVRYAGPLLDYGNVIIHEPRPGVMLIFAGVSALYVSEGEVVVAGAPLALMGGTSPESADFMRDEAAGGGTSRSETLYIEVRQAGRPVDPSPWFAEE